MMWAKEISKGGPHGDHNPPGRAWGSWRAQVGCAHLVHLLLMLYAPKILKYSEKNIIKFSEHSKNFYFWVIFLLHEKFRKQTKHGILFYLTNKNRE